MPETIEQTQPPTLEKSAPVLASHIANVRARMGAVALGTGIAMALPILFAWLALTMPLDSWVELPRWARALLLAAGFGGAGFVAWRFGVRHWMGKVPDDRVALAIEREVPGFRSRFIASVQLAGNPGGASRSLVNALVNDTTEFSRGVAFREVVNTERLRRWLAIAGGAAVLGALLWLAGGRASWTLFKRAWLVEAPVPRKTQITGFTGDRVIALGDDLRIEATASGEVPRAGKLWIKGAGGKRVEFTIDADPLNGARFFRTLQSVQEGFEYSVELGDNRTPSARVRVRPRPAIAGIVCEQQWPPYTKLPPQRRAPGELKLLAGSKLAVRLKPSTILREAQLHLVGADKNLAVKSVAMRADIVAPGKVPDWNGTVDIPKEGVNGVTFRLVDEEGVESKGMAVYRIDIVPDALPTVQVLWPERREELVTPRATLLVSFEAKDDFGIGRIRMHYAVNWVEGAPHRSLDLDLGGDEPKSLTRRFEWKLDRLKPPLTEGDVVDYWFEVIDTNNVTGPGIAMLPDHWQARVVSDEEKRADLAARLGDTLQGLNDVKAGQEDLAKRLGEMIQEKKP